MRNFIWHLREFGLKLTLDSYLIGFMKRFLGAKRIRITYWRGGEKHLV